MKKTHTVSIYNLDETIKNKALFVLKCKGTNLSQEVQKILKQHASEFKEYFK